MSKTRFSISADLAAEVMFNSDRTCCVCNERGKTIQIHHIDENPANNNAANLAVLCLECHNDTQMKGGFGRKLNGDLVTRYRDEWLVRVSVRRGEADRRAVEQVSRVGRSTKAAESVPYSKERESAILAYVNSLPAFRKELRKNAQEDWESGITARMVEASYDYVHSLQGVLITLANFYHAGCFDGQDPHQFFSEIISSRYAWHRACAEPEGRGTGGTIVNVRVGGRVISDVEKMVEDMAQWLVEDDDEFDWREWPKLWNDDAIS